MVTKKDEVGIDGNPIFQKAEVIKSDAMKTQYRSRSKNEANKMNEKDKDKQGLRP